MRSAEPQQARYDSTSEIQFAFLVESLIRRTQFDIGEQLFLLVATPREQFDHLLSVLIHFVLLHFIPDQDSPGRKTRLARRMLRMKVCCCQIQLVTGPSFFATFATVAPLRGPSSP